MAGWEGEKPPYMVILPRESCIPYFKLLRSGRLTWYEFNLRCSRHGDSRRPAELLAILDGVVAEPEYHLAVMAARVKARRRKPRYRLEMGPSRVVSIRVPWRLLAQLDELAKKAGVPRNQLIIAAISEFVQKHLHDGKRGEREVRVVRVG